VPQPGEVGDGERSVGQAQVREQRVVGAEGPVAGQVPQLAPSSACSARPTVATEHSYAISSSDSGKSIKILFTGVENNDNNTDYVVGQVELLP
jgi:hypothetical protein